MATTPSIVVRAVRTWLRSEFDAATELEVLPASADELPASMLQSLAGDPVVKRYKDGSTLMRYRFAVVHRIALSDTATRLGAMGALSGLVESVEAGALPALPDGYQPWKAECDTLPAMIAADEASEDYQATFSLEYKKTS